MCRKEIQRIIYVHKDHRPKMAQGDGSPFHYLMFGGVYLPFNEPVFLEQHYITREDGFIPRGILPFIVHHWQRDPNRAERRLSAWERATNNASSLRSAGTEPLLGDVDERSAFSYRTVTQRISVWINLTRRSLTSKSLACWGTVLRAKSFAMRKLRSLFQHLRRYSKKKKKWTIEESGQNTSQEVDYDFPPLYKDILCAFYKIKRKKNFFLGC